MNRRQLLATAAFAALAQPSLAAGRRHTARKIGADINWTTHRAAETKTTGTMLGPTYGPYRIEMESSRQRCVKLGAGEHVELVLSAPANAMVVRYSLPDSADGGGIDSTLVLYRNGERLREIAITSRYCRLYGEYPFTNNPADGKPRNFYDDARLKDLELFKGDVVRIEKSDDAAAYCIIDLVDLEMVAPPVRRPANALSVTDFGADASGQNDATEALRNCLATAATQRKTVWVPPGTYKLSGDLEVPSNLTVQGAGLWHTTFVGDEALYGQADRRLRFKLTGTNSHLADFALDGRIKYRNDSEQNDGIFGAGAKNCTVSRLWIEHTKVGMWFYICRSIVVEGCRLRNTKADGINLCVDTRDCVIRNCTARNTGDDCFAIWPSPSDQGFEQKAAQPGNNVIRLCTGETPYLAHGVAIYGGTDNRIEDCLFRDIGSGCGILISTTFPTADGAVDNNFNGTTVVRHCELDRCGGYDHGWTWRAALQICLDRKSIAGLSIDDITIVDSLSDSIAVIVGPHGSGPRSLTNTRLMNVTVRNRGVGTQGHGIRVDRNAFGEMSLVHCSVIDIANESSSFHILSR
jgi:Alpha-1,3-glucanase catalytic domain D1/Alpha-1,3-glucanase catalytic domain D2